MRPIQSPCFPRTRRTALRHPPHAYTRPPVHSNHYFVFRPWFPHTCVFVHPSTHPSVHPPHIISINPPSSNHPSHPFSFPPSSSSFFHPNTTSHVRISMGPRVTSRPPPSPPPALWVVPTLPPTSFPSVDCQVRRRRLALGWEAESVSSSMERRVWCGKRLWCMEWVGGWVGGWVEETPGRLGCE